MGIAGFQKWLEKHYPHCFVPVPDAPRRPAPGERAPPAVKDYFDHIYVDLNGYIHTVGRRASNEDELFTMLYRELDALFKVCVARQSIFLALDGPASAAKLITQRKRRLGAASKQDRQAKIQAQAQPPAGGEQQPENNTNSNKKKKKRGGFNLLQVTAGTPFMYRLKNALCFWACSRLQSDPKYHLTRIYISGPDVPGEGELKIMEFIVSHANADSSAPLNPQERVFAFQQERNAEKFRRDSHLIVGTDADLILLGLSSMLQNVFILTTQHGQRAKQLFSIWEFCRSLEQSFPFRGHCNMTRLDFILLSLLQGNDYLPKLRGASLERVWARYRKLKQQPQFYDQFLVNPGYTLNVPFLMTLLCAFASVPPLPSSPASSPDFPPTSVPYSLSSVPSSSPSLSSSSLSSSSPSSSTAAASEAERPAYPPALSSLFHSATQLLGAFPQFQPPTHAPLTHHQPSHPHGQQQQEESMGFVDPAIISSSASAPTAFPSTLPPVSMAGVDSLPDDPSIIAASASPAMAFPSPYFPGTPYYYPPPPRHPYHPHHPAGGGMAMMYSNPYLAASAFPAPVPSTLQVRPSPSPPSPIALKAVATSAPVAASPASPGQGTGGDDDDDEAEAGEEVICFQPPPAQSQQSAEDLIGEAIDEEYEDDDDEEEEYESDEEKEREEKRRKDPGNEEDEDMDDDEEEEEFVKGLIFGHDSQSYVQGLFWCLKMYMEARDLAHELLQPYMALDSKLGSIFREPTLLVDVQLIDSVLSEIPEASLPPDLCFAHTHYYQRAANAGYGPSGWYPQARVYQHQRYQHPPGPFVPSLLPESPCQRYEPLWQPEYRLKCAFYPTRSYPSPSTLAQHSGGGDPRGHSAFNELPHALATAAPGVDHLRLPYYRPFAFLSTPRGGHVVFPGYRGGRGGQRGGARGARGAMRSYEAVTGPAGMEGTAGAAVAVTDGSDRPPADRAPGGSFVPRPDRGRGRGGYARGRGRGRVDGTAPLVHPPQHAHQNVHPAAAAGYEPAVAHQPQPAYAQVDNGAGAGEGNRGGRGGERGGARRGGRGRGRRGGEGGGQGIDAAPHQHPQQHQRQSRGAYRAVYKPKAATSAGPGPAPAPTAP